MLNRESYIEQPLEIESELKTLFGLNEAITIFEIGACEGEDTVKYARLFPNAKLYAFEPLPNNVKLIEKNLIKYNITNVNFFNKALSSKDGTAEFYVSNGAPKDIRESDWDYGNKSSSLLQPDEHFKLVDFIKFNQKIDVETIKLDTFCKTNGIEIIDFIHMDVQGAELMVLDGATDYIKSIKAIWLEVSKVHMYKDQPLVDDVKNFMYSNNFVLVKDCTNEFQGDHLYISKSFFPNYKKLFLKGKPSILKRLMQKVRLLN